MQSFLKLTADNTYNGFVQRIAIVLIELYFCLDLQKRKNSSSNSSKVRRCEMVVLQKQTNFHLQ